MQLCMHCCRSGGWSDCCCCCFRGCGCCCGCVRWRWWWGWRWGWCCGGGFESMTLHPTLHPTLHIPHIPPIRAPFRLFFACIQVDFLSLALTFSHRCGWQEGGVWKKGCATVVALVTLEGGWVHSCVGCCGLRLGLGLGSVVGVRVGD